jgi:hypothetical protein
VVDAEPALVIVHINLHTSSESLRAQHAPSCGPLHADPCMQHAPPGSAALPCTAQQQLNACHMGVPPLTRLRVAEATCLA